MIVQIYTFVRVEDALAAVGAGVDHIGFVAGKYGLVHGELDFDEARRLSDALPETARASALTMSTDVEEILRMAQAVSPDIVHVSTELEEVGLEAMKQLRDRLPPDIGLMKAIPVEDERSIEIAVRFAEVCDILLLDTKVHGFPGVGATGQTHDWKLSRQIVLEAPVPVILAGGLNPENVAAAIEAVRPWGVDSNTATNLAGDPLAKDLKRVAEFARAARRAGRLYGEDIYR
jgi:phosphoribosylanthranilate isomerase